MTVLAGAYETLVDVLPVTVEVTVGPTETVAVDTTVLTLFEADAVYVTVEADVTVTVAAEAVTVEVLVDAAPAEVTVKVLTTFWVAVVVEIAVLVT